MFARLPLWLCLLFPWTLCAQTKETQQGWIRDLGHSSFQTREAATQKLWEAGESVRPLLETVQNSPDPEVGVRARWVLQQFDRGILLDTPAWLKRTLRSYYNGDNAAKLVVFQNFNRTDKLSEEEKLAWRLRLVQQTEDDSLKKQLVDVLIDGAKQETRRSVLAGDNEQAEISLRKSLKIRLQLKQEPLVAIQRLAAFWLLTGKAQAELDSLGKTFVDQNLKSQLLLFLERPREALEVAKAINDKDVQAEANYRLKDWKAVREWKRSHELPPRSNSDPQSLGYRAVLQKLCGEQEAFEETLARLETLAEDQDLLSDCLEKLLICQAEGRAMQVLKRGKRPEIFPFLCASYLYREALQSVGVENIEQAAEHYLERSREIAKLPTRQEKRQAAAEHLEYGLQLARCLNDLGARKTLDELLTVLEKGASDSSQIFKLLRLAPRIRQSRRACLYLGKRIQDSQSAIDLALIHALAGDYAVSVSAWRTFYLKQGLEPSEAMLQAYQVVLPEYQSEEAIERAEKALKAAEAFLPKADASLRSALLKAIVETCQVYRWEAWAEQHQEEILKRGPSSLNWLLLGDLRRKQEKWAEAAEAYARARDAASKPSPEQEMLAMYLEGWALDRAGEPSGQQKMRRVHLLPLSDTTVRRSLAEQLHEREMKPEALEQWRTIMTFGQRRFWSGRESRNVARAFQMAVVLIDEEQPELVADYRQQWHRYLLSEDRGFLESVFYLYSLRLIRQGRALGLAEAGDIEGAMREARAFQAALPGNIELALKLTPLLEKKGFAQEADEVFRPSFERGVKNCKQFPTTARHLNDTAWLAARCNKELDIALDFAQRAVEIAPGNPAYLDTLAEVHFRRGDRETAIKMMRQCLRMDTREEHFQKQIKRFTKATE